MYQGLSLTKLLIAMCLLHSKLPSSYSFLEGSARCFRPTTRRRIISSWQHQQQYQEHRHQCRRRFGTYSSEFQTTPEVAAAIHQQNPTLDWKGASHSNSSFATHVLIQQHGEDDDEEAPKSETVERVLERVVNDLAKRRQEEREEEEDPNYIEKQEDDDNNTVIYSASQLLEFGSVWYLKASAPRDPSQGAKPVRLKPRHAQSILRPNDYLRVHHSPRRYRAVYDFDWGRRINDTSDDDTSDNNDTSDNDDENNDKTKTTKKKKPGVIVDADSSKGWIVIDKPALVPVHMTVDNCLENVATCLQKALHHHDQRKQRRQRQQQQQQDEEDDTISVNTNSLPYVTTPQRLDQNTSGLLVVATSKEFAAYFAKLLRYKTRRQLDENGNNNSTTRSTANTSEREAATSSTTTSESQVISSPRGGVHKLYRCLVCLFGKYKDNNNRSMTEAAAELQNYAETGNVMRHYLEPSNWAPKRFVKEHPSQLQQQQGEEGEGEEIVESPIPPAAWPECLLKVRKASPVYALWGNSAADQLRAALWDKKGDERNRVPENCQGVMELEIELLTGRTHQIRGQLAADQYSIVGDVQYGGSRPANEEELEEYENRGNYYLNSDRMALQCCELEFLDPNLKTDDDGTVKLTRSERWNKFRLETAWWTPFLRQYENEMQQLAPEQATTSQLDISATKTADGSSEETQPQQRDSGSLQDSARPDLLPPRVSLSPGKNKYVLIRATHPNDNDDEESVQWFVKSAAPRECGGPYHGNVAQDLSEWIEAAGYAVTVTGGGRIDYRPSTKTVVVYGFSYGFGKGDHAKAAELITKHFGNDMNVSYDNSEGLY